MPCYLMGSNLFWMCTGSIHSACSDSLSLCSRVFSFPPLKYILLINFCWKFSLLVIYRIILSIKYMYWYPVSCELPMNHLNLISTYLYILKKWSLRVKYGGYIRIRLLWSHNYGVSNVQMRDLTHYRFQGFTINAGVFNVVLS